MGSIANVMRKTFTMLDVPLPPMLLDMAGVKTEHLFVALYQWYSKPTWSDGKTCTGFSFYNVWQPYTQHQAIAHQLVDLQLGWDEQESTHALVCDRAGAKVYVATFASAVTFLNSQHPQTRSLTIRHWENIKAQALAYTPVTFDVMQQVGMFDLVLAPTTEQMQQVRDLINWLDRYV